MVHTISSKNKLHSNYHSFVNKEISKSNRCFEFKILNLMYMALEIIIRIQNLSDRYRAGFNPNSMREFER